MVVPTSTMTSNDTASDPYAPIPEYKSTKTVLVLGASYAGHTAAQSLVQELPVGWRVVVIERNTHFHHLYAFPRVAVVPSHENKVFVPYNNIFKPAGVPEHADTAGHTLLHGCLTKLDLAPDGKNGKLPYGRGVATYRPLTEDSHCCKDTRTAAAEEMQIRFDYLVYALGCHLPPPINIWSTPSNKQQSNTAQQAIQEGDVAATATQVEASSTCCMSGLTSKLAQGLELQSDKKLNGQNLAVASEFAHCRGSKKEGVTWLQEAQARIRDAKNVVIIGAGALGVQFATDIACYYGTEKYTSTVEEGTSVGPKNVTLLVSGQRLLPRFEPWMHEQANEGMEKLGVQVLYGARADMSAEALAQEDKTGEERVIRTLDGREVRGDLVLFCTGQRPCTNFLSDVLPSSQAACISPQTKMAKVNRYLQLALPPSESSPQDLPASSRASSTSSSSSSGASDSSSDPTMSSSTTTSTAASSVEGNEEPRTTPFLSNIFVVGDAADAFGALNAGHTAWAQAQLASKNICSLIQQNQDTAEEVEMKDYHAPLPGIKVSLGLDEAITQSQGKFSKKTDGCLVDLNTGIMWTSRGFKEGGEWGDYRE